MVEKDPAGHGQQSASDESVAPVPWHMHAVKDWTKHHGQSSSCDGNNFSNSKQEATTGVMHIFDSLRSMVCQYVRGMKAVF